MQLRGATATHVGNVRETNQDRAHFGGYVAVVADGMGGHQGGEMAASIAISEFIDVNGPIGPGGLVELVEDANQAVFQKAADPDLRGMGTTLVALTLRPTEAKVSVVNVGDSRAYFLRAGKLDQLTLDHSLVEDLVRQKRLTPEEALTHPQRNILTRALGIASHVEVDRFLVSVEVGDRFLLCSDGLFNEVPEDGIARILQEHPEPNQAADALVGAALAGAGRDNITVAIVDVVDDGHGGNLSSQPAETLLMPTYDASQAGGDGDGGADAANNGFSADVTIGVNVQGAVRHDEAALTPATSTLPGGGTAQPVLEATSAGDVTEEVEAGPAVLESEIDRFPDETAELPVRGAPRKRKRRGLRGLVVLVLLAAVAGGLYVGGSMYARSGGWFVGESNGKVTVFEGQPGGFLFFSPGIAETDVDIATLTDQAREDLQDKQDIAFESEDQAREFIGMISVAALSGVETTEDTQDLLNDIGGSPDSGTATEKPTGTAGEEQPAPSTARSTTTTTPDDQENGT